jgi:hypothetical protein
MCREPSPPTSAPRKLDILFMIDNSSSMAPLQGKLLEQFPVFMDQLKATPTPDGAGTALPDIHVAVVSSDTGPGKFELADRNCRFRGDGGQFQAQPRGSCTASPWSTGRTADAGLMQTRNFHLHLRGPRPFSRRR